MGTVITGVESACCVNEGRDPIELIGHVERWRVATADDLNHLCQAQGARATAQHLVGSFAQHQIGVGTAQAQHWNQTWKMLPLPLTILQVYWHLLDKKT